MKQSVILTVVVLTVLTGCKRKQAPEPVNPNQVTSVAERMADKEYVKQLDAQRDEQKRLAAQAAEAKTDEEKKAAAEALEANRQKTMAIIRERMKK